MDCTWDYCRHFVDNPLGQERRRLGRLHRRNNHIYDLKRFHICLSRRLPFILQGFLERSDEQVRSSGK